MTVKKNIIYNKTNQLLDIYLPADKSVRAVFLYFHGGGLVGGSKEDAEVFANDLTAHGVALISANYRLFPNAEYPDFLEDAADAVAWFFQNRGFFDDCKKLFVGGSSAGGYLSMMLCFDSQYLQKHGLLPTDITGFVHDFRSADQSLYSVGKGWGGSKTSDHRRKSSFVLCGFAGLHSFNVVFDRRQ